MKYYDTKDFNQSGGINYAKNVLDESLGKERGDEIFSNLFNTIDDSAKDLLTAYLEKNNPEFAEKIKKEQKIDSKD